MIWAVLAFLLVAVTKYLTAIRLRRVRDQLEADHQAADELRQLLGQVAEKEGLLRAQAESLMAKQAALHKVVVSLEHALRHPNEPSTNPRPAAPVAAEE